MNYTLHLTEQCNLRCKYCYQEKGNRELSFDNIKSLLDNESNTSKKCTITFFGGEPLLKKDLIYKTVKYAKALENKKDIKFNFKMNTNGTLLDDDFIKFSSENFIHICYSIDGNKNIHNLNRNTASNDNTFDIVNSNAKKLLNSQPYAIAMLVVTINNLYDIRNSVEYLFSLGFKYIICALDYTANWNDEDIKRLKVAYGDLAELYYEKTLEEDSFYLIPFEHKMDTHITKERICSNECQLGLHNVEVGSDGNIYPCMQFVGLQEYIIGDCKAGVDKEKQHNLAKNSHKEYNICRDCSLRERCKHTCGCLNLVTSGNINQPSPLICETEKMIIEISDKLAGRLYKKRAKMFIQKKYNKFYPLIEMFG